MSLLFGALASYRRRCFSSGRCKTVASNIPVIVVGNISVGGTGKTPLTQALVGLASQQGMRSGIVSRGHGGQTQATPYLIDDTTTAAVGGDEPLLHYLKTGVSVVVCTDRAAAVQTLSEADVDLAFSDDGLQHYKMQRAFELAVVDGDTGFANGLLLPAGPLREPISRLTSVDIVAVQVTASVAHPDASTLSKQVPGLTAAVDAAVPVGSFFLRPGQLRQIWTDEGQSLDTFSGKQVAAIAGIGSPERFFQSLRQAGLNVEPVSFDDHHAYSVADFESLPAGLIIVTGKDAVKIKALPLQHLDIYELEVEVDMSDTLKQAVDQMLSKITAHPNPVS